MKSIVTVVFLMLATYNAMADSSTLIFRMDGREGMEPSCSLGLVMPEIEIWGFGLNEPNPTVEIGKLVPVKVGVDEVLLLGGYISRWGDGNSFLEPFGYYERQFGDLKLAANLFAYIPTGSGPQVLGSSGVSLTIPTGKGTRAGVTGTFWSQDGHSITNYGPCLEVCISDMAVFARYLPFGGGEPTFRLQVCMGF